MKGATIIARSLEELGVECVFGYTGAAILPVMDELGGSSIKIVVNANEQCAAFSAAGYSRSTDKVGVAIVTSGPAITNTLTAVADSYADGIPLLIIAGQVPEHKIGTEVERLQVFCRAGDEIREKIAAWLDGASPRVHASGSIISGLPLTAALAKQP